MACFRTTPPGRSESVDRPSSERLRSGGQRMRSPSRCTKYGTKKKGGVIDG